VAASAATARLGMNLSGPADWNSEIPFVDAFRLSRTWVSQKRGAPWGKGPELSLDERGWVRKLEPDSWAETLVFTGLEHHYPGGRYAVLYEGEGKLDFRNAARIASEERGRTLIDVDPSKGTIFIRLLETKPENPLHAIRIIPPGFEATYRDEPFHPKFLERWKGIACLRFMDWMLTNGSTISRWSERPRLEDATFTKKGVPVEIMVDLANRLGADPWFSMPHLAGDEYVREFAREVRARLAFERKVYVEYSNEVWNGIFPQHRHAAERGQELGFAEKPWEAAWRYTAHRSVQIFRIWEEVFGGAERLVRVLASQAANPYVSERILEFRDAHRHADALGIAPYLSLNVHAGGEGWPADKVAKWTAEDALDYMEKVALPEAVDWIRRQKAVAEKYGLELVAYEGGQHMVGVGGAENDERVTKVFQAANAHERMAEIYRKYYEAWTSLGGGLFCYFSSVSAWNKWGSWGILQYPDDDPARSPKFRATMRWAKELGQPVRAP
ncbi:MAG: hypothetical protein ACUVYA_19300, partial [Planctomycetota bacterium]